ncbi:PTS IIA-like nitrogen regulatory protein PtsN [Vineibacter terrae]|uniref:PTS IIA-like nitrogen regulatory protein PtsN n=1 Tax=Vineibacter terrae TaxID=2586908 RepID=A0A5C8PKQ4_9HYPH|nr:PTS IIA-like nitrogen regulatory protein PtsN [Vineibacter terrae]TXL73981.1 PTS IIA-like nitrogen regulatory protein PtsN [Vineibacter terrae]
MELADILGPDAVIADMRASSKKQALLEVAQRAATVTGLHERTIFDVLLERERLGSTGLGGGIAIPHGKMSGLGRLYGVFARLAAPIDFEAIDARPVDLMFVLLAPESAGADHLKALSRVSRALRDRVLVEKLRATDRADALYALLVEPQKSRAA